MKLASIKTIMPRDISFSLRDILSVTKNITVPSSAHRPQYIEGRPLLLMLSYFWGSNFSSSSISPKYVPDAGEEPVAANLPESRSAAVGSSSQAAKMRPAARPHRTSRNILKTAAGAFVRKSGAESTAPKKSLSYRRYNN